MSIKFVAYGKNGHKRTFYFVVLKCGGNIEKRGAQAPHVVSMLFYYASCCCSGIRIFCLSS